jgi:hypothetical protein
MKRALYAFLSFVSLAFCLVFPVRHFLGGFSAERYKTGLIFASLAWFIFASLWASTPKDKPKR